MRQFLRLTATRHQKMLMMDLGLAEMLGVNLSRPSMCLNTADCEQIMRVVPRSGRTAMALRRKVAHLLKMSEATDAE